MCFTAEETRRCLKCKISPRLLRTAGLTYWMIFAGSKLLGCIDNQIFLNMALRCARERPTLIYTHHFWKEIKLDVSYVPTYERR